MKDPSRLYEDIINLPHHVSKTRPQMPIRDRAAQFAPFAAVVGHQAAIKETERLTEEKPELDEMEKALIDEELRQIEAQLPSPVTVKITYFQPDALKSGGAYLTLEGQVKKLDAYNKRVILTDGTALSVDALIRITR